MALHFTDLILQSDFTFDFLQLLFCSWLDFLFYFILFYFILFYFILKFNDWTHVLFAVGFYS